MARIKHPATSGYLCSPRPHKPTTPTPPAQPPRTWPYNDSRLASYHPDLIQEGDHRLSALNGTCNGEYFNHVQKAREYAERQATRTKKGTQPSPVCQSGLRFHCFGRHIPNEEIEKWTAALAAAAKKGWKQRMVARVDSGVVLDEVKSETVSPRSPPSRDAVPAKSAMKKRKFNPSEVVAETYQQAKRVRIDGDDNDQTTRPSSSNTIAQLSTTSTPEHRTDTKLRFNFKRKEFLDITRPPPTGPEVETMSSDSEATISDPETSSATVTADNASESAVDSSPCGTCKHKIGASGCLCEGSQRPGPLLLAAPVHGSAGIDLAPLQASQPGPAQNVASWDVLVEVARGEYHAMRLEQQQWLGRDEAATTLVALREGIDSRERDELSTKKRL
ncbi:hypothetical protein LTR78_003587 [Recurvomyces mirabilis]|uniref:Uncharacterized protein n=1 Tax=Recurvomyces mirabilis TaxID=574656 RepID=A0AAE0WR67_9PEZI|nr:hypothetical protein LTR78_003587 [Recurvomyces mirabilis]KAK5154702.1 hypothetical protein LTS14_006281 [Recurvomyces mirabilis]